MQFPIIKDIVKEASKEQYSKYLAFMPDLKQENSKKFITIVLTIATSIILGLFAINPTISTIANLWKQIDDNKSVDQRLQEKINNLALLQQAYTQIQNDLPTAYDAIPTSTQIPALVGEIQALAKDSNITFDNLQTFQIDLSKNLTSKKYSSYDFGLSGSGTYQDIMNFLDKLVNFQRIIIISNVSISKPNEATGNSDNLKVNIKGTVLFKP